MIFRSTMILILVGLALAGCNLPVATQPAPPSSTTMPAAGTPTSPVPPTGAVTAAPTAIPTAEPTAPPLPAEAILILEPQSGARIAGASLHIAGIADPVFEQTLGVRLLDANGQVLATAPAMIAAEAGQRGPFTVDVPVQAEAETPVFIQVFAVSPRDGAITHLSTTVVTLLPPGSVSQPAPGPTPDPAGPEKIVILQPAAGATLRGGVAQVEGFGLASFEQTLVVEVQDVEGTVVGSQPLIVQAPDLGQPGPFRVDISYTVTAAGPGRIVVFDPSPAHGGDIHRVSIEITLEP